MLRPIYKRNDTVRDFIIFCVLAVIIILRNLIKNRVSALFLFYLKFY